MFCRVCHGANSAKQNYNVNAVSVAQNDVQDVITLLSSHGQPSQSHSVFVHSLWRKRKDLFVQNGKLFLKSKSRDVEVVNSDDMTVFAKNLHHSLCHIGSQNILERLSRRYFCPGMSEICNRVVDLCISCLQRRSVKTKSIPPGFLLAYSSF